MTTTNLVRELKTLRKGRGVHAPRMLDRIGPALAASCGITTGDGSVAARRKLVTRLSELVEQLPEDLQLPARAAFGLTSDARQPLYGERVSWVAAAIDRDTRTVRRRVDDAIDQLADLAATTTRRDAGGWHTAELFVVVTLDQGQPEVLESYQVVAEQDGVNSLEFASVLLAQPQNLDVRLMFGGTLQRRSGLERPSFRLVTAEPLARGETHDFAIRYRLQSRDAMHPCVFYMPERPCDVFDLRLRFGQDGKRIVRTFDGVLPRSDGEPSGMHQAPDMAGDVHLRFRRLLPGLLYGARWGGAAACSIRRMATRSA